MTHECTWRSTPRIVPPAAGDVHVYRTRVAEAAAPGLLHCLTGDERARADRFLLESARARFVVARAGMRRILGACLDLPPHAVPIFYGATGKPTLDTSLPPLHFNVTHAGDLVLYALATDRPVGIDVEPVDGRRDFKAIAERFFSVEERAQLAAFPGPQQGAAFYQAWARKEALAKATGEGLWLTLDRYAVPVSLATPNPFTINILPRTENDPARHGTPAATWMLHDLTPAPGYAGALAAAGADWTCRWMAIDDVAEIQR